jgi:hypothetical protein
MIRRMKMNKLTEWLWTSAEPWTRYRAGADLLGLPADNSELIQARKDMEEHPQITGLIEQGLRWGEQPFKRHNDASYPIYAISTLADFGLDKTNPQIAEIAELVLEHVSGDGGILTKVNIPKAFGGSGEDVWTWIICDMPTLLYALISFGYSDDERVKQAVNLLAGLAEDNGWRCCCDPALGKFKGPGKKSDPCPIVNIYALKVLSLLREFTESKASRAGSEAILSHWEKQKEVKYYLFGIGTDFRKIKYPYVWYNILHVLETLSRSSFIHKDTRYIQMLKELQNQADEEGKYTASSMYRSWKEWSFADKKNPSPWLTFLALRIISRSSE